MNRENDVETCDAYYSAYSRQGVLIILIPILISIATSIAKLILSKMGDFNKPTNISWRDYRLALNSFLIAYVLQGIVPILVTMKVGGGAVTFKGFNFPFLQGDYSQFSKDWYRFIGSQTCWQMFLNIW